MNGGSTPRRAATLEDVAARAGVSRATASRVLRGDPKVRTASRTAVLAAAEELSYQTNHAARALVTGRSESIAFVVSESEERMFTEPFFLGMLRAAHEVAARENHQIVFVGVSTEAERHRFVDYAAGGHVDGVLLLSVHGDDDLQERLEGAGVPTVLSGRPSRNAGDWFHVDADNVEGGRLATAHLLATNHRAIATVTGPLDMTVGLDRLEGYRRALADAGREYDPSLVVEGGFTMADGMAAAERLLATRPDVDAVVAASDLSAIGVARVLRRSGRDVGANGIAVTGFDDSREAAAHHPPLTTVRQPVPELGATMAELLLARIVGREISRRGVVLPVELVVRESA